MESPLLDLSKVDLDELARALEDQSAYEHRWLIDPQTGELVFWTEYGGIDGEKPVDLDDLDLVGIHPLPSYVWYRDMADFAELISDERAGRRLSRAIQGKGAFRRFKDELHEEYPELLSAWYAFPRLPCPPPRSRMARRLLARRPRHRHPLPRRPPGTGAALGLDGSQWLRVGCVAS